MGKPLIKIASVYEGANIHLQNRIFTNDFEMLFRKSLCFISLKFYKNLTIVALSLQLKP